MLKTTVQLAVCLVENVQTNVHYHQYLNQLLTILQHHRLQVEMGEVCRLILSPCEMESPVGPPWSVRAHFGDEISQ